MIIDKPGVYADISESVYHADPCGVPSLSSGIAKKLINESPWHAWTAHPRLNPEFEAKSSATFDKGAASHALLLGNVDRLVLIDADDYRTKAAQAARDEAREAEKIPILPAQLAEARAMAQAARRQLNDHRTASEAFERGTAEKTLVWQDVGGVWCRARLDWHPDDGDVFDDYKTTATSVNPSTVGRWMTDQGQHIQEAFYCRGIRALKLANNPTFRFIAQENCPPYALSVLDFSPEVRAKADAQVEYAIRLWGECLRRDRWPGYIPTTCTVDVPPWAFAEWDARQSMAELRGGKTVDQAVSAMLRDFFAPLED